MTEDMPKAYEPADIEDKWRSAWRGRKQHETVLDSSKKPYSIAIPPPNVTGILTLGHVLNTTIQDILARWHRMHGHCVCWFPGTDHAGIATESRVERHLRETEGVGRRDIGREAFISKVWEWKGKYGGTIIEQLKRLGCSCDWSRERFTLDDGLSDAVRLVFVKLHEKGYIYRGRRMINWCPISRTALSDEEVIHREVDGHLYHFRYPLSDGSGHLVVATTRPETMLGDTAVAVHPDDSRHKSLIGKTVELPLTGRRIPVIADTYVDPAFGTGCVKITPAHDPNDFAMAQRHSLPLIDVMNPDATMSPAAGEEFVGMDRFECREKIVRLLQEYKLVDKIEPHHHSVGYSERGDVPIEPRITEQWFVDMKKLAAPALEAVRDGRIKFHPDRWVKVYNNWLENIQDWCISRQIWWGHRIPAWHESGTGRIHVGLAAPTEGGPWTQDEDVLDTWFSSWLWPFSIMGWPEETEELKYFYPTNDLVTGPDIIFFWVARMIMAGLEFKSEVPFQNVYFTSIIRDAKGRKLSKSLGNSPDPLDVIARYGADALRFSIIYIAPVGIDIRYADEKCELGRNFANKLWNACRFRQLQGPASKGFETLNGVDVNALSPDEQWILWSLGETIQTVNSSLEAFQFHTATHKLYEFVWGQFCDLFIEAEKTRLLSDGPEKIQAMAVLDHVVWSVLRLLHPFMPYITEELAHQMGMLGDDESIWTASFPKPPSEAVPCLGHPDPALMARVHEKFEIIRAGRNLRSAYAIPPGKKVEIYIQTEDNGMAEFLRAESATLDRLLHAQTHIDASHQVEGPTPSAVTTSGSVLLPLKGVIDLKEETAKLEKQRKELLGWIQNSTKKLANEKFVSNAAPEIVEEAKERLKELEERLARVDTLLTTLS